MGRPKKTSKRIKMEILLWPRMQLEYIPFMNLYSMAWSLLSLIISALLSTANKYEKGNKSTKSIKETKARHSFN